MLKLILKMIGVLWLNIVFGLSCLLVLKGSMKCGFSLVSVWIWFVFMWFVWMMKFLMLWCGGIIFFLFMGLIVVGVGGGIGIIVEYCFDIV